jgi:hypothetical protein
MSVPQWSGDLTFLLDEVGGMVYVGSYSKIVRTGVVVSNWSSASNARAGLPSQKLTGTVVGVIQALLGRLVVFVGVHRNGSLD